MSEQDEGGARLIRRKFEATKTRENLTREALERVERQLKTAQEDLEQTVKNARREGYSVTWIAEAAGVARGTVYKWIEAANTSPADDHKDSETDEEKEIELPW